MSCDLSVGKHDGTCNTCQKSSLIADVKCLKKQRDEARSELAAAKVTIDILNNTIKNLEVRVKESNDKYERLFSPEELVKRGR